MVVHDFHFVSVPVAPSEANAPLIIDTDTELSFSLTLQVLEAISGRYHERGDVVRRIEHNQLSEGGTLDSPESPYRLPSE
jgi:hypothetical protein